MRARAVETKHPRRPPGELAPDAKPTARRQPTQLDPGLGGVDGRVGGEGLIGTDRARIGGAKTEIAVREAGLTEVLVES